MEYLVHALIYAMKILEWNWAIKFGSFDFAHKRAHHARHAEGSFYVTQRGYRCTSSYVAGTPFPGTCLIRYQHVATCLFRVVCFKSEYKWMELFSNPKYLLFNRITGNRRYFEETTSLKPPCTCMLDLNSSFRHKISWVYYYKLFLAFKIIRNCVNVVNILPKRYKNHFKTLL